MVQYYAHSCSLILCLPTVSYVKLDSTKTQVADCFTNQCNNLKHVDWLADQLSAAWTANRP